MLTSRARQWVTSSAVRLCTMFKFDADDFAIRHHSLQLLFHMEHVQNFTSTQIGWRRRRRRSRQNTTSVDAHDVYCIYNIPVAILISLIIFSLDIRKGIPNRHECLAWHEGWSAPHVLCLITFFPYVYFRLRIKTIWSCGSLWFVVAYLQRNAK